jgi:hypothetical protein
MKRTTAFLTLTLEHNRKLLDDIVASGMAWCYNTDIVFEACEAIEAELRCRGVL